MPINISTAKRHAKMDLYTQYAIGVAKQAVEDSGLDGENEDLNKIGVIFGAGIGGIRTFEEEAGNYASIKKTVLSSIRSSSPR